MAELIHTWLEAASKKRPDECLILWDDGRRDTVRAVWETALAYAQAFSEAGLRPGDRVAVMMNSSPDLVGAWFGSSLAGTVIAPINTAMRGPMLSHMIDLVDPTLAVMEVEFREILEETLSPGVELWSDEQLPRRVKQDDNVVSGSGAGAVVGVQSDSRFAELGVGESDPCAIMFTSGTTGPSKGVIWTHRMANGFAASAQSVMGYSTSDISHTALPLFHANALCVTLQSTGQAGGKIAISRNFSASGFWRQIVQFGATNTSFLGSMIPILWSREHDKDELDHNLRIALSVPFPSPIYEDFVTRYGLELTTLYGSTDVGLPLGIPHDISDAPIGTCGVPLPDWECRIVDEHDFPVEDGVTGELVVRPLHPWLSFTGYWRDEKSSFSCMRNFWFHTGDYARKDSDGWYYFADRKKDYIRKSGENVSAYEVEVVLLELDEIQDAAVVGVPSELGEDDVLAVVVVSQDFTADFDHIESHCRARLPYFAVPRYFRLVSSIPRTSTEKVRKGSLREEGVTVDTLDRGQVRRSRG